MDSGVADRGLTQAESMRTEVARAGAANGAGTTIYNPTASQGRALSLLRDVSLLPVLVLLIVAGALMSPVFFQSSNFWGIGQYASSIALITAGEALVVMIGSMDLSLGGTYGFAPMLAAWLVAPASAFGAGLNLNP